MYFSVQNYPVANPRPYDDTGWTMQYMRNVKLSPVRVGSLLDEQMTLLTADAVPPGGIDGYGATLVIEHTTDNALMAFRYRNQTTKMFAAEEPFDINRRHMPAGSFIIPNADRNKIEPMLKELGLTAWATAVAPAIRMHEMKLPRIGLVHSWSRTQDEGWVRAAFDAYGVPYTYF